jgi:hypothetical protein
MRFKTESIYMMHARLLALRAISVESASSIVEFVTIEIALQILRHIEQKVQRQMSLDQADIDFLLGLEEWLL